MHKPCALPCFCQLLSAYCFLLLMVPSAYCLLPTAFCFLPSAFCFLPSAYCLLPTASDWCPRRDSNPEPTDYESAALTVELQGHTVIVWRRTLIVPTPQRTAKPEFP